MPTTTRVRAAAALAVALLAAAAAGAASPPAGAAPAASACTRGWKPSLKVKRGWFTSLAVVSAKDVWAVGWVGEQTTTSKGVVRGQYPLYAHWNGRRWSTRIGAQPGTLQDVAAVGPNDIWAVGSRHGKSLIVHYDGHTWTRAPGTSSGPVLSSVTAVGASNVWAVGEVSALHYDGTRWASAPRPGTGLTTVGVIGGAVWTAGFSSWRWNGSGWTQVSRATNGLATGLSGAGGGGWLVTSYPAYIERWDGRRWSRATGPAALSSAELTAVAATSSRNAWAVGKGARTAISLHWDGRAWTVVNAAAAGRQLTSVAIGAGGGVWAAGFLGRPAQASHRTGVVARYVCG